MVTLFSWIINGLNADFHIELNKKMASSYNRDFSVAPPTYLDITTATNYQRHAHDGQHTAVLSDSPHESDDEEVAFLKSELRRIRARNENAINSSTEMDGYEQFHLMSQGRIYNNVPSGQSTYHNRAPSHSSTTVHVSPHGPVYQHTVTAVSNNSSPNTVTGSGEDAEKDPGPCVKMCGLGTVFVLAMFVTIVAIMS